MQTGGQEHLVAYGNYDANEKAIHLKYEPGQAGQLSDMLAEIVEVIFMSADVMHPGFGYDPHKPTYTLIAKIDGVSADKDGVCVKLTTKWIRTRGAYAKRKVKESFDKVKSGEYYFRFAPVINERSSYWTPLAVELEVKGNKLKMKPAMKRCLKYDAKEERVGSVLTSKVMEEIGKKLAEEEDQVNVKLAVKMKDETEFRMDVKSLEKDDDMWSAKVSGGKKALDYLKSANIENAVLMPLWLLLCEVNENGDKFCGVF